MIEKNVQFLEECFKKYYFNHFDNIQVPIRTKEREFGYQKFNSGMIRHLSIKDNKDLHLLLMNNIPSDVYCSNAYYSFPNLPMNEKDWKEADLIFDIDAKDLNLDCRKKHSITKCLDCKEVFLSSDLCPNCNSSKLDTKSVTCKNCISASKNEVNKLVSILTEDLGVDELKIDIFFSGNEGFHVYVYESTFQTLGSRERSDLADYILFKGAIPETFGIRKFESKKKSSLPELNEKGWRGRFAKEAFGSKSKRTKMISQIGKKPYSEFQNMLLEISQKVGVKIDPNVTMDVHRIFRLPGSLNSKSGMAKVLCDDLENFDPFQNASFITDKLTTVTANCPVSFRLGGKKFGPYSEKVEVPGYAAVYMICKGLAEIS